MRTACIMFLFALMLQGCGKKGPLYLPKPQHEQAASQGTNTPNTALPAQPQSAPAPSK